MIKELEGKESKRRVFSWVGKNKWDCQNVLQLFPSFQNSRGGGKEEDRSKIMADLSYFKTGTAFNAVKVCKIKHNISNVNIS